MSLARAIRSALEQGDPRAKVMATRALARDWRAGRLGLAFDVAMPDAPGRPAQPELLPPNQMPKRRRGGSERGRIALAHIEFVAIDLALDMAGRFGGEMGAGFVGDFLKIAADEAMHFALIERHLHTMGSHYGALPAHGGLWEAASATAHDVAARLAVVPMVLEARALDVTPPTVVRVRAMGDEAGARILERILRDEIIHVRIGADHFTAWCAERSMGVDSHWKMLVRRHFGGAVKPPFNDSARADAGLSRLGYAELATLTEPA